MEASLWPSYFIFSIALSILKVDKRSVWPFCPIGKNFEIVSPLLLMICCPVSEDFHELYYTFTFYYIIVSIAIMFYKCYNAVIYYYCIL